MNNEQLDRWLAENVMGWEKELITDDNIMVYRHWGNVGDELLITDDGSVMDKYRWHPTTSIEQAMMCAEKLDRIEVIDISIPKKYVKGFYVVRLFTTRNCYKGIAVTKELAICHAIYESRKE